MESVRVRGKFGRLTVKLLRRVFLMRFRLQTEKRFSRPLMHFVLSFFLLRLKVESGLPDNTVNHRFYFVTVSPGRLLPTSCDVRDSVSAGCRCRR